MELFEIDSRCWSISPSCTRRELCYFSLILEYFRFSHTEGFFALRISVSRQYKLDNEESESEYHEDEYIAFWHRGLPERYLERFVHFVKRKLCVHGFICELICVFIFFTEYSGVCHFLKFCNDAFCFLVEYFESCVFDLVDSLELFDDEFTIHDEMDFCCSEFLCGSESEDCSHIFCLIIGRRSEEEFSSFYHLRSLVHDKSAPAWARVSS